MSAITAPCDSQFRAAHDSGMRGKQDICYVVIHDEEAPNARGTAIYFASSSAGASTHLAVDDNECYRCLPDLVVPWGAPPLNKHGLHVEQAGYSSWSKVRWLLHLRTIQRCAYHTAVWCKKYQIPARWLDHHQLAALGASPGYRKGGITSHRNVTLAFRDPNSAGHTDPGPNYPYSTFLWWVRHYLKGLA